MIMDRRGHLVVLLFCALAILSESSEAKLSPNLEGDKQALLTFQAAADGAGVLNKAWNASSPCTWTGIKCENGRVAGVSLNDKGLNGTFKVGTLSGLTELQNLTLSHNSFKGSFPLDLSNLTGLLRFGAQNSNFSGDFPNISTNVGLVTLNLSGNNLHGAIPNLDALNNLTTLDLSHNSFEGRIPPIASSLTTFNLSRNNFSGPFPNFPPSDSSLVVLDLSHNNLSADPIPTLSNLNNLKTLDLSDNSFGGPIPTLPSNLAALNMSDNLLTGQIPTYLAEMFPSAFLGNSLLCGNSTNNTCPGAPSVSADSNSPWASASAPAPSVSAASNSPPKHNLSTSCIVLISVGAVMLFSILILCSRRYYYWRGDHAENGAAAKGPAKTSRDHTMTMTSMDSDKSKLSFLDDSQHGYNLDDLLRASAEMLGKGSFGTAYKAVMSDNGLIVAVKRLTNAKDISKKEFDHHMDILGRLRHPNLVPLRAYYYAREEKLLIYDFMENGSLFSLLHGSRGPGRTPLELPARISIAQGVAQGLAYLHRERESHRIPHGNLKSSNVLMGRHFEVCISDFGLGPLMPTNIATQRMAGYRAPEYHNAKKITHKADIYSFGVLLLELLTGRQPAQSINDNGLDLPKWVHSMVREEWTGEVFDLELKAYIHGEEDMVTLLQIAINCVEPQPEQRPEMAEVVELLDGIRRGDSVMDTASYQSGGDYSQAEYSQDESRDYSSQTTPSRN